MIHRLHNSRLSGSGIFVLPVQWRRAKPDPGLYRYMLEVYDYVACGLAVTGLAAYLVTFSGFHASMVAFTSPFLMPFLWILLLAPLALLMVLWLSVADMSLLAAHATAWTCSALTGFVFGCISLVYTGTSLAPVSFIAAGTFSVMSVYGFLTRTDLSQSRHFLGMGVVGVVLASIVNIFLASTPVQSALSVMAVIALVGLTAGETKRIKDIYLKSDDCEPMSRTALVGALALYLDANPVVLLLRLEDLHASKRNG